jgi:hypothetical protein
MRDSGKENRALRSGGLQLQAWSKAGSREGSVEAFRGTQVCIFSSTVIIECYLSNLDVDALRVLLRLFLWPVRRRYTQLCDVGVWHARHHGYNKLARAFYVGFTELPLT